MLLEDSSKYVGGRTAAGSAFPSKHYPQGGDARYNQMDGQLFVRETSLEPDSGRSRMFLSPTPRAQERHASVPHDYGTVHSPHSPQHHSAHTYKRAQTVDAMHRARSRSKTPGSPHSAREDRMRNPAAAVPSDSRRAARCEQGGRERADRATPPSRERIARRDWASSQPFERDGSPRNMEIRPGDQHDWTHVRRAFSNSPGRSRGVSPVHVSRACPRVCIDAMLPLQGGRVLPPNIIREDLYHFRRHVRASQRSHSGNIGGAIVRGGTRRRESKLLTADIEKEHDRRPFIQLFNA